jgi:hypothetical protein
MITVHHVVIGSENSMVAVNGKPIECTNAYTRLYNHAETTLKLAQKLAEALNVEVIPVQIDEPKNRKRWTYRQVMARILANQHHSTAQQSGSQQ